MTEPSITPELVAKHNLSPDEYKKILELLGRTPSYTELGIFSVMWSEHCSYKNTRPLLKTFPTKSPKILVGAGEENAGIIDIGDDLAIAFKIESHNHPSAVEPFQGAATGVGGIIRDIFTMGARPVCAINSLRFGPITEPMENGTDSKAAIANNKRLFAGVVSGIARIAAARRASESGNSAVEASRRNVEFGTGTEFDLLNAQNNYYAAQRAYSQTRYDYLTSVLTLKQQAGRLSEGDLAAIDALLVAGQSQ